MEYVIRQKFRKEIRSHRYQFTFTSDGKRALEQLRKHRDLDMVLTDIRMPEMDGLTLLGKLKEIDSQTQAVVVSAYGDMDNIRAAMNLGAFDFLIKPLDLKDLELTVEKTLAHTRRIRHDRKKLKNAQQQLKYLAYHDGLTGLANREQFINRLNHAMDISHRNPDKGYAVLFLDLDDFKRINDSLGHSVGDNLLKEFANSLKQSVRYCDTVSRFGGDEFVVLLEQVKEFRAVLAMVRRIQEITCKAFILDQHKVLISVSIGITVSDQGYQFPEDVIRDADVAMYRAKLNAGSSYVMFNPDMQRTVAKHLRLESELRRALEHKDILAHYQPIYATLDQRLTGFEVLARWPKSNDRWISPADFILVAEESGLINLLGQQILELACTQMHHWQEQYPSLELTVSVNVSVLQLMAKDFVSVLETVLNKTGVDRMWLKLEITESSITSEIGSTEDNLRRLRDGDFHLCIDDFGTGYSSLSRLYLFPIKTLKIDQSFVRSLCTDDRLTKLVSAIIALGHSLGLDLVAEGVETKEQLDLLTSLGCENAQGFLMNAPMSADAATRLLEKETGID